jgi:hypothetical protein
MPSMEECSVTAKFKKKKAYIWRMVFYVMKLKQIEFSESFTKA